MQKLRFLIRKNHVTAEMVREYADRSNLCMMDARKHLSYESKPILQYFYRDEWNTGHWEDVPTVVEYINEKE